MSTPDPAGLVALIDFPNLIAGAILGYALSLPQQFSQKRKEKRQVGAEWTKELRRLEPLLGKSETRYADLYAALSDVDIDRYRRVLGPDDFRLIEDLQNAYAGAEHAASEHAKAAEAHYLARRLPWPDPNIHGYALLSRFDPATYGNMSAVQRLSAHIAVLQADPAYVEAEDRAIHANHRLNDLRAAVMNRGRERSRNEYNDLMRREDRAMNLRHPVTWAQNRIRGWWRRRKMNRPAQR